MIWFCPSTVRIRRCYAVMEKHCRRLGIHWQMLQADRQTETPGLFSVEERFLPMLQVYGAQAVNAVSFALAAGMDPASAVHALNKRARKFEQFEQTQLPSIAKVTEELERKQGRLIVMGSGHSHMLQDLMAQEKTLDNVVPILEQELMVFDPVQSGWTQAARDYAQMLIDKYKIQTPGCIPDAVQHRKRQV